MAESSLVTGTTKVELCLAKAFSFGGGALFFVFIPSFIVFQSLLNIYLLLLFKMWSFVFLELLVGWGKNQDHLLLFWF